MKLLLTSGGITNKAIAKAFLDLVGKKAKDTRVAFIPTAANVEQSDKDWLINDLYNLKKLKLKCIDIVDISALPKKIWLPRLKAADVLFFSGGNSFWLAHWLKKSGLAKLLPRLLKTRVYAGISAGSIVTAPSLFLSSRDRKIYYEKIIGHTASEKGLGFVDFHIRPHFNSPHFPRARAKFLKKLAKEFPEIIYALDDRTAIKVDGKKVKVVGSGKYLVFNQ